MQELTVGGLPPEIQNIFFEYMQLKQVKALERVNSWWKFLGLAKINSEVKKFSAKILFLDPNTTSSCFGTKCSIVNNETANDITLKFMFNRGIHTFIKVESMTSSSIFLNFKCLDKVTANLDDDFANGSILLMNQLKIEDKQNVEITFQNKFSSKEGEKLSFKKNIDAEKIESFKAENKEKILCSLVDSSISEISVYDLSEAEATLRLIDTSGFLFRKNMTVKDQIIFSICISKFGGKGTVMHFPFKYCEEGLESVNSGILYTNTQQILDKVANIRWLEDFEGSSL